MAARIGAILTEVLLASVAETKVVAGGGRHSDAVRLQVLAAETCASLYLKKHKHRRPANAELDAWLLAADYTLRHDPGDYDEAYRLIREAERFAVLGIPHEYLRNPDPSAGFGGILQPAALPDHLRRLWRLSAKLHMAVGAFDRLDRRVRASLPARQRTNADYANQREILARELVATFAVLSPERRPRSMDRLIEWAGLRSGPPR